MLTHWVLFHESRDTRSDSEPFSGFDGAAWIFETCLRKVALYSAHVISDEPPSMNAEVFEGSELMTFLTEIACGLHSPMVGETEVFGQFKRSLENLPTDSPVLPLLRQVLSLSKKIRREHLQSLGSQTYGSVSRRLLKKCQTIHVLGAGKLTEELLPWFEGFDEVELFCRTTEKGELLKRVLPKIRVFKMGERMDEEFARVHAAHPHLAGLVIAAPMENAELEAWIASHAHPFEIIVDLRGGVEPIDTRQAASSAQLISLQDVFASIECNRQEIAEKAEAAKTAIRSELAGENDRALLRPLGWEEICA